MNNKKNFYFILIFTFVLSIFNIYAEGKIKEIKGDYVANDFVDNNGSLSSEDIENEIRMLEEQQEEGTIRDFRSSEMIDLDEKIFSGTTSTIGPLYRQYLKALDAYLELNDYNSDLIFLLGNEYFLLGRMARANMIFNKDNKDLKNLFGSATTYRMMGDNKAALEKYNMAMSMDGSFAENYIGRGLTYRNIEEYEKAENDLKTYISMTKNASGYLALGDMYFKMKRFDDAEKIIRQGIEVTGESVELNKLLKTILKNK